MKPEDVPEEWQRAVCLALGTCPVAGPTDCAGDYCSAHSKAYCEIIAAVAPLIRAAALEEARAVVNEKIMMLTYAKAGAKSEYTAEAVDFVREEVSRIHASIRALTAAEDRRDDVAEENRPADAAPD